MLAFAVLVSHSWPLSGTGHDPQINGVSIGSFAVAGFFAISGYLIVGSRLPLSTPRFLWHRFLRIYPGMWSVLAITAFVFAPLVSWLYDERWTLRAGLHYVKANFTSRSTDVAVPGTLLDVNYGNSDYGGVWNGSLWTLQYEIMCYLVVAALLMAPVARRAVWPTAAVFIGATVACLAVGEAPDSTADNLIRFGTPFAAGALLRLLGDRVRVCNKVAGAAALATGISWMTGYLFSLGALPLAFVMLWLGANTRQRALNRTDISYGVYIYAFPVQQMIAQAGIAREQPLLMIVLTTIAVVPLAYASWHLIERPALRLKHLGQRSLRRGPGDSGTSPSSVAGSPQVPTT